MLDDQGLPTHVEETIQSVTDLHARQAAEATAFQRGVARLTRSLGSPRFLVAVGVGVVCWIGINLALVGSHTPTFDPPPFQWLQGIVTLLSLCITILILSTQRRDDVVAEHREKLMLELAIISDQKSAKIIRLLEDLRRDLPMIPNRVDSEALAMSTASDPHAVYDAIKESIETTVEELGLE